MASMVRPPLTSREKNSMFMDTLPSPYYDMLVVNAFIEFEDLMYSVGRIEDGIKKGKIVDIETTTFGKEGNISNKHVKERSRGKFKAMGESVGNLFHSRTSCTQVPPIRCFSPQMFAWKNSQGSDSGYYQSKKRKKNQSVPHTSNVLWRIAPHTGPELWDFCYSYKTKKTSISERIRY